MPLEPFAKCSGELIEFPDCLIALQAGSRPAPFVEKWADLISIAAAIRENTAAADALAGLADRIQRTCPSACCDAEQMRIVQLIRAEADAIRPPMRARSFVKAATFFERYGTGPSVIAKMLGQDNPGC